MPPAFRQKSASHRGKAGDHSHCAQIHFLTQNCEHNLVVLGSTESLDGLLWSNERPKQQHYTLFDGRRGGARGRNPKLPHPVGMGSKDPSRDVALVTVKHQAMGSRTSQPSPTPHPTEYRCSNARQS